MSVDDNADAIPQWAQDVLHFWFAELTPEAWFKKSDAADADIVSRFMRVHDTLHNEGVPDRLGSPREALARVIVLDQFPRNMFRGTPRAFASDPIALEIARRSVDASFDATLSKNERLFLYLPFEHAEDANMQVQSVALISALGDPELTRYAQAHKDIIDRFGRYPHRNTILGRASTPEEIAFLKTPGSSF